MADAFTGEIRIFAGNYAPPQWASCDGQLLKISDFQALYSLIGITYGGDDRTIFGIPDMRGRVPVHQGQGPNLSNRVIGQKFGTETVTLTMEQMPAHNHTIAASINGALTNSPKDNVLAMTVNNFYDPIGDGSTKREFASETISYEYGNLPGTQSSPHYNIQPCIALNFIICLNGVYPSRN